MWNFFYFIHLVFIIAQSCFISQLAHFDKKKNNLERDLEPLDSSSTLVYLFSRIWLLRVISFFFFYIHDFYFIVFGGDQISFDCCLRWSRFPFLFWLFRLFSVTLIKIYLLFLYSIIVILYSNVLFNSYYIKQPLILIFFIIGSLETFLYWQLALIGDFQVISSVFSRIILKIIVKSCCYFIQYVFLIHFVVKMSAS